MLRRLSWQNKLMEVLKSKLDETQLQLRELKNRLRQNICERDHAAAEADLRSLAVWFCKVLGVNILTERTPAEASSEVTATVTIVPRGVELFTVGVIEMDVLERPLAVRIS